MTTTDTTIESLEAYRVAMIEELGFSKEDAKELSAAYYDVSLVKKEKITSYKQRVDHHYLRKLLDAGATLEQVKRIVL